jgi:hypothetical protein
VLLYTSRVQPGNRQQAPKLAWYQGSLCTAQTPCRQQSPSALGLSFWIPMTVNMNMLTSKMVVVLLPLTFTITSSVSDLKMWQADQPALSCSIKQPSNQKSPHAHHESSCIQPLSPQEFHVKTASTTIMHPTPWQQRHIVSVSVVCF